MILEMCVIGASTSNPATWASYEDAERSALRSDNHGIGFVFTQEAGMTGVDLDNCRDADSGEIADWAMDIMGDVDGYTEISPSGTGVHIIARGRKPEGGSRRGDVEMYDRGRYFTITGSASSCPRKALEWMLRGVGPLHDDQDDVA